MAAVHNTSLTPIPAGRTGAARRELLIFFVLVVFFTAIAYWLMLGLHWPDYLLLWTPAISSIIARLLLRIGFNDISFRFKGKYILIRFVDGCADTLACEWISLRSGMDIWPCAVFSSKQHHSEAAS
ncbi:hypothetical protein [Ktedonosporobacter rubrisoli]|uniref:hypothetical protein n=1 Tax=Ktedonosporobacter rubrisoli TaxID=2509675 RepID=UPI0013EE6B89|nr:hypothetical protein [Ktedonosporobacter rubrisoli]